MLIVDIDALLIIMIRRIGHLGSSKALFGQGRVHQKTSSEAVVEECSCLWLNIVTGMPQ